MHHQLRQEIWMNDFGGLKIILKDLGMSHSSALMPSNIEGSKNSKGYEPRHLFSSIRGKSITLFPAQVIHRQAQIIIEFKVHFPKYLVKEMIVRSFQSSRRSFCILFLFLIFYLFMSFLRNSLNLCFCLP